MARFEPVRQQTFPYSEDVGVRPSTHEGPDDNDIVFNERSHPGRYHAISPMDDRPLELEAGYNTAYNTAYNTGYDTGYDRRSYVSGFDVIPPPAAASEQSRVTLFYHGYTTDENRHWIDDDVLSSGDETVRNAPDDGYNDRTPMVMEAALPAGSTQEQEVEEAKKAEDPNLITWSGPDDPLHPHNWPAHRRWTSTILIAMFAFIAPMASTMLAPALEEISDDLDAETDVEKFLLFSIFLLAFAM